MRNEAMRIRLPGGFTLPINRWIVDNDPATHPKSGEVICRLVVDLKGTDYRIIEWDGSEWPTNGYPLAVVLAGREVR